MHCRFVACFTYAFLANCSSLIPSQRTCRGFLVVGRATEASRVESAGGKIQKGKVSLAPYGFMVLAVDTESNIFGVHSQEQPR
ncbi:hypothetical protein Poly41_08670 [Novipirellula artificiosorum]|uniref:Glyoxalase-like domain protein n=1 Tax=Novipirellula artificiosorum TaxID=2528016 RepID=A0A5C6E131_9BACT|nr:hypothetical protein Poly41_08670 [Novipirellula artificiosorum]